MTREIKFRIWDKKGNEMLKDYGCYYDDGSLNSAFNDIDVVFMQYTGLKDKNGKEIYEGDIVEIPDDYDEFGFMALEKREVYFLDGCFRLKPLTRGRGHTIEDNMDMCEVIGNIYENPNLIPKD